jgi:uncharacterized protein YndB with AHSA1/START domain
MQTHEFTIEIHAPKERVWSVLWEDATFRDWSGLIDEGTYMQGELGEGQEVQFISEPSGYGVTSLVTRLIPNEFVSFKQMQDTKDSGEAVRQEEWTGGEESYSLSEHDGITTLTERTDIPPQLEEIMKERIPKALARIKEIAETVS